MSEMQPLEKVERDQNAQRVRSPNRLARAGCAVVLVGLLLICLFIGSIVYSVTVARANPEFSTEQVIVPAKGDLIREVGFRQGRYEYRIFSQTSFDFYSMNLDQVALYRAGRDFQMLDHAKNVKQWETWVQGYCFAMVFVNHNEKEASILINLTVFPDPPLFRDYGVLLVSLLPMGLLLILIGTILAAIAFFRARRKKRSADTLQVGEGATSDSITPKT